MKKALVAVLCLFTVSLLKAQVDSMRTTTPRVSKPIVDQDRSNDQIMLQMGVMQWAGIPDSIQTKGISKSFNVYLMFDFPFKTNPKLSMAFGPGIASDHAIFGETNVGIKENAPAITFTNVADTNHFKKTKLATTYLEAPVEFRYNAKPGGNGFKFAIGVKVGALLNAHTRNSELQDKNNNLLNDYIMKESSKRFFNKTRLSGMLRVGYGHFTVFGSYQLTQLFKDGAGPVVRPFTIGLTLSAL